MPQLFGRYYTRAVLERRVGRLDQIAGIGPVELVEGGGQRLWLSRNEIAVLRRIVHDVRVDEFWAGEHRPVRELRGARGALGR